MNRPRAIERSAELPGSLIVAVLALGAVLAGTIARGVQLLEAGWAPQVPLLLYASLQLLALFGFLSGSRLAWQWGRGVAILGGILSAGVGLCAVLYTFAAGTLDPGVTAVTRWLGPLLLGQGACLCILYFALGTPSARAHFGVDRT